MDIINFFCKDLKKIIISYIPPDKSKYNNVLKELEQLIIYTFYTLDEQPDEDEYISDDIINNIKNEKYINEFSEFQNLKNLVNIQIKNPTYNIKDCIKYLYNKKFIYVPKFKSSFNRYIVKVYGDIEEADIDDLYYLNSRIY